MNYWLMKSEPETYSIDHLKAQPQQTDHWDGIRNYQVRNMLRDDFKVGDIAFFYHSNCKVPGIAGIMTVAKAAYPDFTAFDPESKYYDPKSTEENPRWFMVDVKYQRKLKRYITLEELRQVKALADLALLRKGNRLSITAMSKREWDAILALEIAK